MNWLKRFFSSQRSDHRAPARFPLTQTERFEPRLVLGGIGSPATGAAVAGYDPYSDSSSSPPTENVAGWTSIAGETADESSTPSSYYDPSETTPDVGTGANTALVTTADSVGAGDSTAGDLQVTLTSGLSEASTEPTSPAKTGVESPSSAAANNGDSASSATGAAAGTSTFGSADTGGTNAGDTVGQDGSTISNDSSSGGASATGNTPATIDTDSLRALGLELDENGNAIGTADTALPGETSVPWWQGADEPVVVKYDFRDQGDFENLITADEQARAIDALNAWSDASGGKVIFERDQSAPDAHIINIGTGDMRAFGYASSSGGTLGVGGGRLTQDTDGKLQVTGAAWLDVAENWDTQIGNGDPAGTYDYFTVVSHELGHTLGYDDARQKTSDNMMTGVYDRERSAGSVRYAVEHGTLYRGIEDGSVETSFNVLPMTTADVQLTASEVKQLLERAAAASASSDGIFAVVDRNGRILGVRCEQQVVNNFAGNTAGLVFAIDGAIAKARTAAFFANGDAESSPSLGPLTSRVIQFISQSTVTQREVEGNPNADNSSAADAAASTTRGPGFVAPIGVGGHFPPAVADTPPVDLFAIEHTNRDSNLAPGADGVKGTADDIALRTITDGLNRIRNRFNMDPTFVPTGQALFAPESYGNEQNSNLLPDATSRGIATLPGGIPIYKDANGDGRGDTVVGGIGVFFPGTDGFATYEQGFVPGIGQTQEQRLNAPKVLEAEYIAYAAIGGSFTAEQDCGVAGARIGTLDGVAPVAGIDLPFGRIDLVGITLALIGPTAGLQGLQDTIALGKSLGTGNRNDGADQPLTGGVDGRYREGEVVPEGWLVMPHSSTVDPALTAADVTQIITQGINAANAVRAAIRLPIGSRTRMVFAVTDTSGEVLGLYRMPDATVFSIDVAVAKARNTAYYADATDLQPVDQVAAPGVAFSNRTFRFLAEPRYPSGVEGSRPPAFSILLDPGIVTQTAENAGAPTPAGQFNSVLGHDAFNIMTNFRDPGDPSVVAEGGVSAPTANQSGIVFFPGSTSIYKNGQLVGGLGVSGDGVDQDDVVTFCAAQNYLPTTTVLRADQVFVDGVRLPYLKFLRNPFG